MAGEQARERRDKRAQQRAAAVGGAVEERRARGRSEVEGGEKHGKVAQVSSASILVLYIYTTSGSTCGLGAFHAIGSASPEKKHAIFSLLCDVSEAVHDVLPLNYQRSLLCQLRTGKKPYRGEQRSLRLALLQRSGRRIPTVYQALTEWYKFRFFTLSLLGFRILTVCAKLIIFLWSIFVRILDRY